MNGILLAQAVERLTARHGRRIDLSLGRIRVLLRSLGNPHFNMPPIIHVAGTNGKGSVIAFLRSCLEAGGWRVHTYTSPHLIHFNERVRLANPVVTNGVAESCLIDDVEMLTLLERCSMEAGDNPVTFFEISTAAAFLAFADHDADLLLLETGLGGRLDATNVIEQPVLTVITQIALDHQDWLGETLTLIAAEKAGILKAHVPCVSMRQCQDTSRVLRDRASELSVTIIEQGLDWQIMPQTHGRVAYESWRSRILLPKPGLAGAHQFDNAGLAMACLDVLNEQFPVSEAACQAGIRGVVWPGRMQYVAELRPGIEVWLDGGHNPHAAVALAEHLRMERQRDGVGWCLVVGMLATKDRKGFLRQLIPEAMEVICVDAPSEEAGITGEALAQEARILTDSCPVAAAQTVMQALAILKKRDGLFRILVTGSLFLAGHLLGKMNGREK